MSNLFDTTIIGTLVGVIGTGLGGIIALSLVRPNKRFLSMLLGATSGLMLAVVTFDLLPEAIEIGGLWTQILGVLLGIVFVIFIEDLLPKSHDNIIIGGDSSFLKTGMLIGVGIAMHNFPEGLAIGSGFMHTPQMGIEMAIVIALHNLPEGIAMATPLRIGGFPRMKVLLLTLISGLPTGIGALLGSLLGGVSSFFISLCLAFAGGTMIYITCGELIPNAKTLHGGRASTIGLILGFILGMIVVTKL